MKIFQKLQEERGKINNAENAMLELFLSQENKLKKALKETLNTEYHVDYRGNHEFTLRPKDIEIKKISLGFLIDIEKSIRMYVKCPDQDKDTVLAVCTRVFKESEIFKKFQEENNKVINAKNAVSEIYLDAATRLREALKEAFNAEYKAMCKGDFEFAVFPRSKKVENPWVLVIDTKGPVRIYARCPDQDKHIMLSICKEIFEEREVEK